MKEPVDHILRPCLPWRDVSAVTECGYDASKVKTISREEFVARLEEFGIQRTALFTCMNCSYAAKRWGSWEDDPRQALAREIDWENPRTRGRGTQLLDELKAIFGFIKAHPDEFKTLVEKIRWVNKKVTRNEQR